MMKNVILSRWRRAQKEEKQFHLKYKISKKTSCVYWAKYINLLNCFKEVNNDTIFLDVGCGPNGVIRYLCGGERIGLDPLMDVFVNSYKLEGDVYWIKGVGEYLPFKRDIFDVVLCINVLDHMKNPLKSIKDTQSILKNGGIFMLSVDCHSPFVRSFRIIKERLKIGDTFHPFSFSVTDILNNLRNINLNIAYIYSETKKWSSITLLRLKQGNLTAIFSNTIRFILSLLWRIIKNIKQPMVVDDDGFFTFIIYK